MIYNLRMLLAELLLNVVVSIVPKKKDGLYLIELLNFYFKTILGKGGDGDMRKIFIVCLLVAVTTTTVNARTLFVSWNHEVQSDVAGFCLYGSNTTHGYDYDFPLVTAPRYETVKVITDFDFVVLAFFDSNGNMYINDLSVEVDLERWPKWARVRLRFTDLSVD